jgi:deaminated glutathione amidase
MRVALIQESAALDPALNRARLVELTPHDADLVVFPEVFARDFGPLNSSVAAFAEPLDGPFVTEVARVAHECDTTIVAGMFETSDDPLRPFNTVVVRGHAEIEYRKIHLYDSFGYQESNSLLAGHLTPTTFEAGGFRVGLQTCYDLRFPELSRLLVAGGAEVLVIAAAWVAGPRKVEHWVTLARARAIENTVYVVALGQPGPRYSGHSMVVDPLGEVILEAGTGPEVLLARLDLDCLRESRETNPCLAHRRL